ncbi:MAG TPA: alanine racemase [Candidatus Dormibacteraeota bacterium]|nr:alanine racemase [Candidatus Dormibacteraeota bacterium]
MSSTSRARGLNLERILDEPVDWRYKSFPAGPAVPLRAVGEQGWNVLGGAFMRPVMVLKGSALSHNLQEMAGYCGMNGIQLAPHVKTHMSPQLFQMQLNAGAWALTVANVSQARVWRAFGAERIILANELVEPGSVRWVAEELKRDPDFELMCLVDSAAGVAILDAALEEARPGRRLKVLVEVGFPGGRTGGRTLEDARSVASALVGSRNLLLVGLESFEGIIHQREPAATLGAVDGFIRGFRAAVIDFDEAGFFSQAEDIMVSAGGSAFFDRVVSGLGAPLRLSKPVRVVLRSGCYLTHDAVHYAQTSPFGGRLVGTEPLRDAMEIWGAVLSLPEPGLALLGFGKRDVSYDLGLPVPRLVKSETEAVRQIRGEASIFALNDQHAYMRLTDAEDLQVGDLVGCGISHPCTAFDKWRLIPVVDDDYGVLDAVLTYF